MGAAVYREPDASPQAKEDGRVETVDYRSLSVGTSCKACGAPDPRPARPMLASAYQCEAVDRDGPLGRILLCGACAEVHRRSVAIERALHSLLAVPVLLALPVVFVPRTPAYGAMVAVLFASALAMALLHQFIARRLAVRALVLGVRATQVTVWFARTSAAKMPLRAAVRWTYGAYALAAALSFPLLSMLWTWANPAIELRSSLDAPVTLIVNREISYEIPAYGTGYVRVAFGAHRFEWLTSASIPPIEFRTMTKRFGGFRLALPACASRDRENRPPAFRYVWSEARYGSTQQLTCEYLDGAP